MDNFRWPSNFDERNEFMKLSSGSEEEKQLHWAVLQVFECKQRFRRGSKFAVLEAIAICAELGIALPDWASQEYLKSFEKVYNYEVRSWNDAFGDPVPSDKQLRSLQNRLKMKDIYDEIVKASSEGAPIDDILFEQTGMKFGVGKSTTAKLYGEAKQISSKFNSSYWRYHMRDR